MTSVRLLKPSLRYLIGRIEFYSIPLILHVHIVFIKIAGSREFQKKKIFLLLIHC